MQFDYGDEVLFDFADQAPEGGKSSRHNVSRDLRTGGLVRLPKRHGRASKPSLKVGADLVPSWPYDTPERTQPTEGKAFFTGPQTASNPLL